MMKQTVLRSVIVVIGLLCVTVAALFIFVTEDNHYKDLSRLSACIDGDPTPEHLRNLLNDPGDGAYGYYQMALTGASFARHPELFRIVSEDLRTDRESRGIDLLGSRGAGVFEYHPELKPAEFDQQLRDQSWLTQNE